jgi:2TM domain
MKNTETDSELYKKAKERVAELKDYYSHLGIYFLVNIFLFLIDAFSDPSRWWFYWATFGWGIGILAHTFSVFGAGGMFGEKWEDEQIKKYIEKNKKQ